MPISIGFHDVGPDTSGLSNSGRKSVVYTLGLHTFQECLAAIAQRLGSDSAGRVDQVALRAEYVFLTFDDGESGAYTYAAPELEKLGWRGHFFVTTNLIGKPGFLDAQKIKELHQRGHLIGSHSSTHPERMSHLGWKELLREWRDSCAVLSDLTGNPITVASVAGGYYSRKVAEAAAASGLSRLFTSEPTAKVTVVHGCWVLGRYTVRRSTPVSEVVAIAAGERFPRWKQAAAWFSKGLVKTTMGESYISLRRSLVGSDTRSSLNDWRTNTTES
jgi:peptidoglycan/xylan/chitin deacetylase (PgdA/CDA1 family)